MRSYPSCWNKTLTKLGFKRVFKKRKPKKLQLGRHSLIEQLEPRQMLAADTYVVSTLEDVSVAGTSTDDQWSLREALADSANDPTHQAGERDTIKFAPLLWNGTIELDAALSQLVVDSDVTIEGPGADLLTIDAKGNNRVFRTYPGNEVTIEGVTITGGSSGSHGGGIYNEAELDLIEVVITGNQTVGTNKHGGGLYNQSGSVQIIDSLISNNHAAKNGGGIFFRAYGDDTLEMVRSTLANNTTVGGGRGGGLLLYAFGSDTSSATLVDTTVSGNQALIGAGIMTSGSPSLTLINSTVTANIVTQDSAGVLNNLNDADVTLFNSIVAGNIGGIANTRDLARGVDVSSANNLIGRHYAAGIDTLQNEMLDANESPELLPLGNYGGPVPTHMPTSDSRAKDGGDELHYQSTPNPGTQHYLDRVVGSSIDIGAHEYGAKPILADKPFELETLISPTYPAEARVATNAQGKSIAVWKDDGSEGVGVYAQLINPDGAAASQPRMVDLGTESIAVATWNAAIDDRGRFAVAWKGHDGSNFKLYLRRYQSDGTPIDQLPVEVTTDPMNHHAPSIVTNASGQTVISWQAANGDLMFRRYTTSGLSLDAAPRLAQIDDGNAIQTSLGGRHAAIDQDGSFYLIWSQSEGAGERAGLMRHYSAGGNPVGSALKYESTSSPIGGADDETLVTPSFLVSSSAANHEVTPYDVAIDAEGRVTVAWYRKAGWTLTSSHDYLREEDRLLMRQYDDQSGWGEHIEVARGSTLDNLGITTGQVPNFTQTLTLDRPGLAVDNLGRIGIAWKSASSYFVQSNYDPSILLEADYSPEEIVIGGGSESAIQIRWYEKDGQTYSNSNVVLSGSEGPGNSIGKPSLSTNGVGEFFLATQDGNQLSAQRFQLTKPIELVEGQLRINDIFSQFKDITVATAPIEGVRYVTLNGQVTDILASEVTSIDITAGSSDNRIDLSRVSEEHFPSLVINGIPGTIEIRGGAGDDTIFGTALRDTIYGDAGNDEIFGGEDIDAIYGGEGEDVLQGGDGNDNLYGEAGNDRLFGGDGDDSLEGGEGDDRLVGNAGDDTLEGEAGDDLLEGGSGTLVLLDGGEGSDRYLLTEKSATYVLIVDEGTVGIDEIDLSQTLLAIPDTYNASGFPAELDLDSNTAQPVFDATLASVNLTIAVGSQIENATGTRYRDKLTGSTSSNVLRGGLGDDVLLGGDGADELLGEGGDDTLNPGGTPTNEVDLLVGGFGDDVYQLSDDVTTTARINDEAGTDKIDLSTWTGTEGATLDLSLTPDDAAYQTLLEETDNPKLQLSNSGLDQIEEIIGTDNDDVLMGNDLDNVIASGEGSDTLDGKSGNNILLGQKGYDALEVADNVDDAEDASIGYLDVGSGWIPADGGFNGAQRSADNNDVANEATWSFTDLPAGDYDVYVTWSVSEGTPGSSAIYSVGNETFAVSQAENPSGSVVGGTAWHRLENPQANSEGRFTVDSSVDFTVTLAHDAGNGASDVIYADAVRVVRRNQAPSITLGTPAVGHGTIDGAIWEVDNVAELEITVGDGDEDASLLVLDDSLTSVPGVSLDRVGMTAVWKLSYDGTTLDKTHAIILQVADGTDTTTKTVYLRNTNSTNPIAIVDIDSQTSGFVFNLHEANDDDNDPLKTLSVTVNATVANGLDKKFSLGPGAPAGADIDGNGLLTWSPTEDQDGTHQIEVRVTDTGNPPLRVSEWITVNVADIDDVPVLPSDPELVHDTGIANDSRTADAALRGTVTNDGSVDLIEIEVDYDNNGTYDEVVQVEASEDDPSLGYYTINPEESDLVFDASNTVTVRAREWSGASSSYLYSDPRDIDFIPDPDAHDPPTFESGTLKLSNDTGSIPNNTIDPTIEGTVLNDGGEGAAEGLTVHFFKEKGANYPGNIGRPSYGSTETDADGKFSFLPEGLLDGLSASETFKDVKVWVVIEEPSSLTDDVNAIVFSAEDPEDPANIEFRLHEQKAPNIHSFGIKPGHDTGDDDTNEVTSDPWLSGQIDLNDAAYYGPAEGVIIEFYHDDAQPTVLSGATITDANGNFEYLPPGLDHGDTVTIRARAVAWDEYRQIKLIGDYYDDDATNSEVDHYTFTYDEMENDETTVSLLVLEYDSNNDGIVVDPLVTGKISNDGPNDGSADSLLVEWYVVVAGANFDPDVPDDPEDPIRVESGFVVTDEEGNFEFRPLDLEDDTNYDVYSRAIEWDGLRTRTNQGSLIRGTLSNAVPLKVSASAESPATLSGYELSYNTGDNSEDGKTADPTVKGTVDYLGDKANVIVELRLGESDETIVEVTPDELGNFQYTMPGLIDDEFFDIQARVRVPDYTAKAPEFEDAWLNVDSEGLLSADGYLTGYTFDNPETEVDESGWSQDADGNGVPDISDAWLNDLFVGDGTELGGAWYDSDFTRDWEKLFEDYTTDWTSLDRDLTTEGLQQYELDLGDTAPFVIQLDAQSDYTDPTISGGLKRFGGTEIDNAQREGIAIEISFDGGTEFEAAAITDANGSFSYQLPSYVVGTNTFHLRFLRPQYGADAVPDGQITASLTIEADDTLPTPTLELKHPRDEDGNYSALDAIDPTVIGALGDAADLSLRRVQFEYSSNGTTWDNLPDGSTFTDNDGIFEFTPEAIESYLTAAGNTDRHFAIRARVVEKFTSETPEPYEYEVFGEWSDVVEFKSTANQSPTVETFELAFDTGLLGNSYVTLDRVTSDPTLVGRVIDSDNTGHANATVEFSLDGGATIFGTAITDSDGNFYYQPEGLTAGHHDIVVRVQEYDPVKGSSIDDGWHPLTATGDPSDSAGLFTGFTLIEPSPATVDLLEQPALSHGGYDPTVTGSIIDPDTLANVTVDFYRDPGGDNEFLGSTLVDRDGTFSFTPVGLSFGTNITIKAVPRETNYLTGNALVGTSHSTQVTFNSYGLSNSDFKVENHDVDQATDFFTLEVGGAVKVPKDSADNYETVAPRYVEVRILDSNNNDSLVHLGIAEIEFDAPDETNTDTGYRFDYDYDLRGDDLPAEGDLRIELRPVGVDVNGLVFGEAVPLGQSTNPFVPHPYEIPVSQIIPLSDNGDDLVVGKDGTHVRASLEGTIDLASSIDGYSVSSREVEIDYDGDGIADASIVLEDGQSVVNREDYEFEGLEPGEVVLSARAITTLEKTTVVDGDANVQRIEGDWQPIEFTLVNPAPAVTPADGPAPATEEEFDPRLRLAYPREVVAGDGPVSSDPTIRGTITTVLLANPNAETSDTTKVPVAGMTVEIDHNADGVADGTTTVDSEGRFEYTPTGISVGDVTLNIRAIDYYSDTQPLIGDWLEFSFQLAETAPPTVSLLELERSEGTRDVSDVDLPVSTYPVLTGTVEVPEGVGQVIVEFDHDDDDLADGRADADLFGAFTYTPEELAHGPQTIRARAVLINGSERVIGLWSDELATDTSLTFYHASAEPAVVTDLWIEDIDENNESKSGVITGRVTVGGYGQAVKVAVYVVGDTEPNGHTYADSNGFFRYQLNEITKGSHQFEVEGLLPDPSGVGDVPGKNKPKITINYQPGPIIVPLASDIEFRLEHDTGTVATHTANPTLFGKIPTTSLTTQAYAQIKLSTETTFSDDPEDWVAIRPDGTFTYLPEELDPGVSYTFDMRVAMWNPDYADPNLKYLYSNNDGTWSTSVDIVVDVTDNTAAYFIEDPANTEEDDRKGFRLRYNTAASGSVEQSAEPIFVGTIENDGRKGGLTIEFDHNGDGVVDGTTLTREDGSFQYNAVGLEPGELTQTITAIIRETDYYGNERTSTIASLDFILTRAPLVEELNYLASTDSVDGELHYPVAVATGDLKVEYYLFGSAFDRPELAEDWWSYGNYELSTETQFVADADGGTFTIGLPASSFGTASVLVRGVDLSDANEPIHGPWQALHFEKTNDQSNYETEQFTDLDFSESDETVNQTDPDYPIVTDPAISGRAAIVQDNGGGQTILGGIAYGIVQLEVFAADDQTGTPVTTQRVATDQDGYFQFSPNVALGQYDYELRMVHFNEVTQTESLGFATPMKFQLENGTTARVDTFDRLAGAADDDPTVEGTITNPDGRKGGLRVEFSTGIDSSETVIGATITRPDGTFSFTPHNLIPGTITLYARVVDWDPVSSEYASPDFTQANVTAGTVKEAQFDLSAASTEQPELEGTDSQTPEFVQEALRELVFATLDELDTNHQVLGKETTTGTLDLGFGEAALLAGDDIAEAAAAPVDVYAAGTSFSLTTVSDQAPDGTHYPKSLSTTLPGGNVSVSLLRHVEDQGNDTYSINYLLFLEFHGYETTQTVPDPAGGDRDVVIELNGNYQFRFETATDLIVNTVDDTYSGTYDLFEEDAEFAYAVRPASTGDPLPVEARGSEKFTHELANGETGTFDTALGVAHTASHTETNRREEQRNDTVVVTSQFENQITTVTTTTIENIIVVETITRTGELGSSGNITNLVSESYDAYATVDSQVTVTTVYETLYDGQGESENGNDSVTNGLLYNGTISVDTTYSGDTETSNFTLGENSYATVNFSGSGSSHTVGAGGSAGSISRSETWHYGGHGYSSETYQVGGTVTTITNGSNSTETLRASGYSNSSFYQTAHGGGSGTFGSNSGPDNSTSGSGGGTFLQTSGGGGRRNATINAVDEVFTIVGSGGGRSNASSSSTSYGTSRSTSTSDTDQAKITTTANSRSRQAGGGSVNTRGNYDFTTTDQGQRVTGNFGITLDVNGGGGSSVTGKTIVNPKDEPSYTVPFNDGSASSYGLIVSHQGNYTINTLGDEPINKSSGTVKRTETTGSRGSSFGGVAGMIDVPAGGGDNCNVPFGPGSEHGCHNEPGQRYLKASSSSFNLSKGTRDIVESEEYDYSTNNGATTRRGTFDNSDRSTSESLEQFRYSDPNLTYKYRSDSGGSSNDSTDGNFNEASGTPESQGRRAQVNGTTDQRGNSAEEISFRYTSPDSSTGNSSFSSGYSNSKGTSKSDGSGSSSINNDEVTRNGGEGGFDGQSRVGSGGTSFAVYTSPDGTNFSLNFSTGSGTGNARGDSDSKSAGGSDANESGSASARTNSTSKGRGKTVNFSITTEPEATTITRVISGGKSDGNSKGDSSGDITPGDDVFNVSNEQGGESEGSTTQTIDRFGNTFRSHSSYTSFGDSGGKRGFGGDVIQREGGGSLRDGTVTEEGNGSGGGFGKDYNFSFDLATGSVSWDRTVFDNENGGNNDSSTEVDDRSGDQTGSGSVGGNAGGNTTQTGGTFKLINGGFTLSTYKNTHDTNSTLDTSGGFSFLGGVITYTNPSVTEYTEERTKNEKWYKQRKAIDNGLYRDDLDHIDRHNVYRFDVFVTQTDGNDPQQTEFTLTTKDEIRRDIKHPLDERIQTLTTISNTHQQTYTLQGNQESLAIDRDFMTKVVADQGGSDDITLADESNYSGQLYEWVRTDINRETSSYMSQHRVGSDGLVSGGQLQASGTETAFSHIKGTGGDPSLSITAPGPNDVEGPLGYTDSTSYHYLEYESLSTASAEEQGGYWDALDDSGQPSRRGSGSYTQVFEYKHGTTGQTGHSTRLEKWHDESDTSTPDWVKVYHDKSVNTTDSKYRQRRVIKGSYAPKSSDEQVVVDSITAELTTEGRTWKYGLGDNPYEERDIDEDRYTKEQAADGSGEVHRWETTNCTSSQNGCDNPTTTGHDGLPSYYNSELVEHIEYDAPVSDGTGGADEPQQTVRAMSESEGGGDGVNEVVDGVNLIQEIKSLEYKKKSIESDIEELSNVWFSSLRNGTAITNRQLELAAVSGELASAQARLNRDHADTVVPSGVVSGPLGQEEFNITGGVGIDALRQLEKTRKAWSRSHASYQAMLNYNYADHIPSAADEALRASWSPGDLAAIIASGATRIAAEEAFSEATGLPFFNPRPSFGKGKLDPRVIDDAATSQPSRKVYHQGDLSSGIDDSRYLSTSPDRDLGHYNPSGQLYEFDIPADVYREWEFNGSLQRINDLHEPSGIVTPEVRILPPSSGQMREYMKKLGE